MAAVPRGAIRNREYGTQVRDFSGLRFGNITPTDIDGLIEYKDKGYVLIETKYKDAKLPRGQELALERLCDNLQSAKKPTLLIIASHETEGDIDVAETIVVRYRFKGKWSRCRGTTGRLVTAFIGHLDKLWNA
jgi:hypothetical protein